MQICALLRRIQCKVSDTQVTVKACGPLFIKKSWIYPGCRVFRNAENLFHSDKKNS